MGRVGIAFKLFFRALGDAAFAERGDALLKGVMAAPSSAAAPVAAPAKATPLAPARNDALTLLAALQREARLIDFLKENIAGFSNEQIGSAVRDVHRDAAAALERMFAMKPVLSETEGASVTVPGGSDANRVRLTGNVTGQPPYRGPLRHQGWEASKVQLPEWSGSASAAMIIAPAEVELP